MANLWHACHKCHGLPACVFGMWQIGEDEKEGVRVRAQCWLGHLAGTVWVGATDFVVKSQSPQVTLGNTDDWLLVTQSYTLDVTCAMLANEVGPYWYRLTTVVTISKDTNASCCDGTVITACFCRAGKPNLFGRPHAHPFPPFQSAALLSAACPLPGLWCATQSAYTTCEKHAAGWPSLYR